jgi:hypothetical protein
MKRQMFSSQSERSNVDVILSRRDIEKIRMIINKEDMSREDLSELFYLLGGAEAKVLAFEPYDRYLLTKFLTWVGEFVNVSLALFEIKNTESKLVFKNKEDKEEHAELKKMLEKTVRGMANTLRYLVSIYLFISRSTLSLGGKAFEEFTKEKIEYLYPNQQQPMPSKKGGRWI